MRTHWNDKFRKGNKVLQIGMPLEGKIIVNYKSDDKVSYEDEFVIQIGKSGFVPIPEAGPDVGENEVPSEANFYALGRAIARSVGNLNR